jgi:bacteriorhodopsin
MTPLRREGFGRGRWSAALVGAPISALLGCALVARSAPGSSGARVLLGALTLLPLASCLAFISMVSRDGRSAWSACLLVAAVSVAGWLIP